MVGTKRIKKISLQKLLKHLNLQIFTKVFFPNKEDAIKFIKEYEQKNRKEKEPRKSKKQTLANILSSKGVVYRYYKYNYKKGNQSCLKLS